MIGEGDDKVTMFVIDTTNEYQGREQYVLGFESASHVPIDREKVREAKIRRIDSIMKK